MHHKFKSYANLLNRWISVLVELRWEGSVRSLQNRLGFHVSRVPLTVMCHMSRVTCHILGVTCYLSLTPNATATAKSPNMHSRLVYKDPKPPKKAVPKKILKLSKRNKFYSKPILPRLSLNRSLQSTGKRGFQEVTSRQQTN